MGEGLAITEEQTSGIFRSELVIVVAHDDISGIVILKVEIQRSIVGKGLDKRTREEEDVVHVQLLDLVTSEEVLAIGIAARVVSASDVVGGVVRRALIDT